jgi:hypothetical protein|tara:strand:- start:154 stop:276 length:123 start_codon:yes stop_codon:yes gene_type:complete
MVGVNGFVNTASATPWECRKRRRMILIGGFTAAMAAVREW